MVFEIKDTKLYVSVVTLSTQDDNKLFQKLKMGLKKTIKWNKYRPEMSNQVKNDNLNKNKQVLCIIIWKLRR